MEESGLEPSKNDTSTARLDSLLAARAILSKSPSWLPHSARVAKALSELPARMDQLIVEGRTAEQALCELAIEGFDHEARAIVESIYDTRSFEAALICLRALYEVKLMEFARRVIPLPKPQGINEEFWAHMDAHHSMLTERVLDPLGGESAWFESGLLIRHQHWRAEAYGRGADLSALSASAEKLPPAFVTVEPPVVIVARTKRRGSKANPVVQRIKVKVRELRKQGLNFKSICHELHDYDRPPRASWRHLSWQVAYRQHPEAVSKWLSEACS